ncbi:MAG: T9SS type A sorting domain-containing protein, partial [Bacteroidales bacterium]|nr:T9SS type A sorting domain-containing protein [Bacteroidales bacterium]
KYTKTSAVFIIFASMKIKALLLICLAQIIALQVSGQEFLFNMNWFEFTYRSTGTGDQLEESVNIRVFPNPSNGILFVEGSLDNQLTGEIQVFDLLGQKVLEKKINSTGSFRESLHLEHLLSGSYLVVVRSKVGQVLSRKQVIITN